MRLDQKQLSGPVFFIEVFAQICEQAHHDCGKGFRMVSHLQSNDAAEERGRIVNDVGEIARLVCSIWLRALRTVDDVRIFRVYWEIAAQQLDGVSSISQRIAY